MFLNSVLGVLSFNSFDFYVKLGKIAENKEKERLHSSKFWKQIVYNINILITYLVWDYLKDFISLRQTYFKANFCILRLSVWTISSLTDELKLKDVNGVEHTLKRSSIVKMIWSGWLLYLGSIIFNCLYYKIHPSRPDISGRGRALKKRLGFYKDDDDQGIKQKRSIANFN